MLKAQWKIQIMDEDEMCHTIFVIAPNETLARKRAHDHSLCYGDRISACEYVGKVEE